jgi:hypothetical protein
MTTQDTKVANLGSESDQTRGLKSVAAQVCRKCAVRFDTICAKSGFFATSQKCFRGGDLRAAQS